MAVFSRNAVLADDHLPVLFWDAPALPSGFFLLNLCFVNAADPVCHKRRTGSAIFGNPISKGSSREMAGGARRLIPHQTTWNK